MNSSIVWPGCGLSVKFVGTRFAGQLRPGRIVYAQGRTDEIVACATCASRGEQGKMALFYSILAINNISLFCMAILGRIIYNNK